MKVKNFFPATRLYPLPVPQLIASYGPAHALSAPPLQHF